MGEMYGNCKAAVIMIAVLVLLLFVPISTFAQTSTEESQEKQKKPSLAELARQARERRTNPEKEPPVITNATLKNMKGGSVSTSEAPPDKGTTESTSTNKHSSPLYAGSGGMFVDVVLNGFVKAKLLVDTGAEVTVISSGLARQLSLNPNKTWLIPMKSASGVFWAALEKVRSIAVGDATVRDLDVLVYDAGVTGIQIS